MPDQTTIRWYEEIDAANVGPYTMLLYQTWVGDKGDPATTVEEWASIFLEEDLPEEYSDAKIQSNVPPYVSSEKHSYRKGWFDGLKDSQADNKLRVVQEGDEASEQHRREHQDMLNDNGSSYRYRLMGMSYEEFLDAIDRVAENEEDERAWDTIDKWRSRQMRDEERGDRL
jgi:hypothetical protein